MKILPGYTIKESIYEGVHNIIYRGFRNHDERPVILKVARNFHERQHIASLRHEYTIAKLLNHPAIVQILALEEFEHNLTLIYEDFGGINLKKVLSHRRLTLTEFLRLAIQIASGLEEIHHHNIIHKDIKTQNVLMNEATGVVKIAGFANASTIPRETPVLTGPRIRVGTLAYMSPEQTGRMNRGMDYRTDFYSLGITFYEMLTGSCPFVSDDPMELVHAHIAVQPVAPHKVNGAITEAVSSIVMKLLSKRAEDRYQSAYGLRDDLEQCLVQAEAGVPIDDFIPGQNDRSEDFRLSQKLYGRSSQISQLMGAFERISEGKREFVLVPGYSGIGKSSLVNEMHKPVIARRGFFVFGKCDQVNRSSPFAPLIQALQQIIQQLLGESQEKIDAWTRKIMEVLGESGQVVTDVIPEVRHIIGVQPSVQELPPSEAQNRLMLLLVGFIRVFADRNHPLVLFLDDLQWADTATIKVVQQLCQDGQISYLLLIGSYRDNEVGPSHILSLSLEEIRKTKVVITEIKMTPLSIQDMSQMIADALHMQVEEVAPFALAVHARTRGNPFFTIQLLSFLYEEKILTFDSEQRTWCWDIKHVTTAGDTDDVVDLLSREISKLPKNTQEIMMLAACIGTSFDSRIIALLDENSTTKVVEELWEAIDKGMVVLTDSTHLFMGSTSYEQGFSVPFKFLHDGVRQAAYSLLSEQTRDETHHRIGMILLKEASSDEKLEELLFDIVNHFNRAPHLVQDSELRIKLAKLNLEAGRRAKSSGAYNLALDYSNGGLIFLGENSFAREYSLAYALHLQKAECEHLAGNFSAAESHFGWLLEQVQTKPEKGNIYAMQAMLATNQGKSQQAIEIAMKGLALFGAELPQNPTDEEIGMAIGRVQKSLADRKVNELIGLPVMNDPDKETIVILLSSMAAGAYLNNQRLFTLLALEIVILSLNFGNTRFSPFGYVIYGLIKTAVLDSPVEGSEFGQLAINLAEKQKDPMLRARCLYINSAFILHWSGDARRGVRELQEAFEGCLENGDLIYAGYSIAVRFWQRTVVGDNLEDILKENLKYIDFLITTNKDPDSIDSFFLRHAIVQTLTGRSQTDFKTSIRGRKLPSTVRFYHHFEAGESNYLFGDGHIAASEFSKAQELIPFVIGLFLVVECVFYHILSLAKIYTEIDPEKQRNAQEIFTNNLALLTKWASRCPQNFEHFQLIAKAEINRVLEPNQSITDMYEQAIESAKQNNFLNMIALANELAANYHIQKNRYSLAQAYANDAIYAYEKWGAKAKVDQLIKRFSGLLRPIKSLPQKLALPGFTIDATDSTGDKTVDKLDLYTVIKSAQALTTEIVFDRLITKMMKIIMENAGAEKGFLILEKQKQWIIEVEGNVKQDQTPEQAEVVLKKSSPVETSNMLAVSIINYVTRTQESVVLDDATGDNLFRQDAYIVQHRPKSILCLPLIYQGKLNGILYLENNLATDAFTPERVQLLNVISSQAAISLENASLYDTLEQKVIERTAQLAEKTTQLANANQKITALNRRLKAENLRMEAELDIVERLQKMLLPHDEELKNVANLEIVGYMDPAEEVGGDYYDVLVHNGRVKIAIGDVTGHGLESGVLMLMAQMGIRTLLMNDEIDPTRFLSTLNRTIHKNVKRMQTEKYLSLTLIDYHEQEMVISGLHEEIILVRNNGLLEMIDTLELGLPVGLTDDIDYAISQRRVYLNSGDTVILYTDGITEAENTDGQLYGLKQLCNVIQKNWQYKVDDLRNVVIQDVRAHIGHQTVHDDMTLLVIRQK